MEKSGNLLNHIWLLLILLLMAIFLCRCDVAYDIETNAHKEDPRPRTSVYRIRCFNNDLMKPADDFWADVHKEIDGTGYVKTKESWADRISGKYLAQVWVYYEW